MHTPTTKHHFKAKNFAHYNRDIMLTHSPDTQATIQKLELLTHKTRYSCK